jgi:integrase
MEGHLSQLLPASAKVRRVVHHAALPYAEVPTFLLKLREQEGIAARALEYLILTAARTGEVIGARWSEINPADKTWCIPGERMKAGKEHRVPLPPRALAILEEMRKLRRTDDGFVFPGTKGKPLSNMAFLMLLRRMDGDDVTAHGFRSSFRDWAAERTNYPAEVAEMALAHTVSDKTAAAYHRSDLFERRRRLMQQWAIFCATPPQEKRGNVTALRR